MRCSTVQKRISPQCVFPDVLLPAHLEQVAEQADAYIAFGSEPAASYYVLVG